MKLVVLAILAAIGGGAAQLASAGDAPAVYAYLKARSDGALGTGKPQQTGK